MVDKLTSGYNDENISMTTRLEDPALNDRISNSTDAGCKIPHTIHAIISVQDEIILD